jgi:hypothetical protein
MGSGPTTSQRVATICIRNRRLLHVAFVRDLLSSQGRKLYPQCVASSRDLRDPLVGSLLPIAAQAW